MTRIVERQHRSAALVDFEYDAIADGYTVKLPPGALLLAITVLSITAFDGTGTVTGTISDGTTTFLNAVNLKDAVGAETVSNTPKFYVSGGTLTISVADQNSDSAAGRFLVNAEYVVLDRCVEIYSA